MSEEYDVSEFDSVRLGTAEQERELAKNWMRIASQHLRHEKYWRERVLGAAAQRQRDPHRKTAHQQAVEKFLRGVGHVIPSSPSVASTFLLSSQLKLIWEEFSELVQSLTAEMYVDPTVDIRSAIHWKEVDFRGMAFPDLVEVADACGDLMVVVVGMMSLCGIADAGILREINDNNLLKIQNGHMDPISGKFIKPKDHPKPNILGQLRSQGYVSK